MRGGGGWRDGVTVLVGTVAVVGDTVSVWPGTVSVRPGTVTEGGSRRGYRGHAETPSIYIVLAGSPSATSHNFATNDKDESL